MRDLVGESIAGILATPLRYLLLLFAIAGGAAGAGYLDASFYSNAVRSDALSVDAGAYLYKVERSPSGDSKGSDIPASVCDSLSLVSGISSAGMYSQSKDAILANYPESGIAVYRVSNGTLDVLKLPRVSGAAFVGPDAIDEIGLTEGAKLAISGEASVVSPVLSQNLRAEYFSRSILVETGERTIGTCLVDAPHKTLSETARALVPVIGADGVSVSSFTRVAPFDAQIAISERRYGSSGALGALIFLPILLMFVSLARKIALAYFISSVAKLDVLAILVLQLGVLSLLAVPLCGTVATIAAAGVFDAFRFGLGSALLTIGVTLLISVPILALGIGNPGKVYDLIRRGD